MIRPPIPLCLALLVVGSGCKSTQSEAPQETATPATAAAEPGAAGKKDWADMTKDERKEVMKTVVVPRMAVLFKELNAQHYPAINCTLCHGEGAKKGNFGMPNPDLPKLGFTDHLAKERAEKPEMVAFMAKK